jgi:hypothetical protein
VGTLKFSTVKYLCERLEAHNLVLACEIITGPGEEPVLKIERTKGPPVTVHVVWAYDFSFAEYLTLSERVRKGDFILTAGFGGTSDEVASNIIEDGRKKGIGVGNLRRLYGALNRLDVSTYRTREESAAGTKSSRED